MKVSIITVCFNSDSTIEHTLQSVFSQDYSNIELIVIDGASTDGTLEIIDKYRDQIGSFVSEQDNGIYNALNKGIKLASGDIIGLLNSDDFYANEKVISSVVDSFRSSGIDAVYGDLDYVGRIDTSRIIRKWRSIEYMKGLFLRGWMPPHPTFFVKRDVYERLGVFNESLSLSADYELMLRFIHKHGIELKYIPKVLVKMRVGGKGNMNLMQRLKANIQDRKAWKINGLKPGIFTILIKPLRKIRQFY